MNYEQKKIYNMKLHETKDIGSFMMLKVYYES